MNEDMIIERINSLLKELNSLEEIDPLYTTPHMQRVRHYTFFVLSRVEYSLDLLFAQHANAQEKTLSNLINNMTSTRDLAKVLSHVPFSKKLEIYFSSSIITKDMRDVFSRAHKYRNWFAHPSAYDIELKGLRHNYITQKHVLETLVQAMKILNDYFAKKQRKDDEKLAKKLGVTIDELQEELKQLEHK